MGVVSTKQQGPSESPQTLMQAHDMLTRVRPGADESAEVWLRYYRHSAAVYAEVAEVDRGHHHEAMYWVTRERAKAEAIQAALRKGKRPVVSTEKKPTGTPKSETEVSRSNRTVHDEP
jgi:hypothetical protein